LLITKISGIPSKQLRLKFENELAMDDDSKYLSDFKDFLMEPETVEMYVYVYLMHLVTIRESHRLLLLHDSCRQRGKHRDSLRERV
jgi:hypothetical protein